MDPIACSTTSENAIVTRIDVPPTGTGPLDSLRFGVKDLIDVAGTVTGCGNPTWRDTHPPAPVHAVCVEQLLSAGGRCVAKTVTDQLAFSLLGVNDFYGTPLNPRAPDRVPGGSSSGSASAVACGLVDFALGTDTGGSVRVPASNCGLFGLRPSHGLVSVAGVMPFAPTFDTVGVLAPSAEVLARVGAVLLACELPPAESPETVHLLRDAFDLADAEVQQALAEPVRRLREWLGGRLRETTLGELAGGDFPEWCETYCVIQWAEIRSTLGAWIDAVKPDFGPTVAASFALTASLDRRRVAGAIERRERRYRRLRAVLGPRDLILKPTAPTLAPLKGTRHTRSSSGGDYYPRSLGQTSVAGIGRLPEVSLPLGSAGGVPVGLSLLAAHGEDAFLLGVVKALADQFLQ
jgi:amidase